MSLARWLTRARTTRRTLVVALSTLMSPLAADQEVPPAVSPEDQRDAGLGTAAYVAVPAAVVGHRRIRLAGRLPATTAVGSASECRP